MNEIELKARVTDSAKLISTLNSIAKFTGEVIRDDTYYSADGIHKIRIRKEKYKDRFKSQINLITYKRKELRKDADGVSYEVNEEIETEIKNEIPLETFFEDSNFTVTLKKHKEVKDWSLEYKGYTVTLELCTIHPLGVFLEIEILAETKDEAEIAHIKNILEEILLKTGLTKDQIENRYYSEMIKQWEKENGR